MRRYLAGIAALALLAIAAVPATATVTTTGTWSQYPTGAPVYSAQIQQPINSDGSSNWPSKSKGGIPIMFSLSSGTGPAVFESIGSDGYAGFTGGTGSNYADDYAYASFAPTSLTFNDINMLKTDYTFSQGDCHGGSLRWSVRTDSTHALFIYYGAYPNFTDCTTASQSGANMIGSSDLRYDTSQYVAGTQYNSYAGAQAIMGSLPLTGVTLVIDSGWQGMSVATDQILTISNTTVNDNIYQWNAGGTGTLSPTCSLPAAILKLTQTAGATPGVIDETTVVQNFDTGNAFRTVDCKYQYVISIPSLKGAGTYLIEIQIGGVTVGTAGFALK